MSNSLPTPYQEFIALSRYARWLPDKKRRETWEETVDRLMDNVVYPAAGKDTYTQQIRDAIVGLEVMPSMRAMMTAGPALERDNTAGYNCSYLPVDDPKSFDEAMFILLCGTGVGFSVERQYISRLPDVLAVVIVPIVSPFSNPEEVKASLPAPTECAVPYVALASSAVTVKALGDTVKVPLAYVIV